MKQDNFGRIVGGALHKLQKDNAALTKERDALLKERDDLKRELFDEQTWRIAACNAHAILSRGIKQALRLKNWPDFYKLYGDGLFAEGVVRLLNETMDEMRNENSKVRQPKRTRLVSGRKHARKRSCCA